MTKTNIFAAIAIAASVFAANTASAQFGSVDFPTMTFADEFDGTRGKAKACTTKACKP